MPRRRVGERWNCAACGKPLIGALTRKGAVAPIEIDVDARGNVHLWRSADNAVHAWTMSGAVLDEARAEGVQLRLNHFAYCPERERFKREREST